MIACTCGHGAEVHGFGVGECWACGFDNDVPDCERFEPAADRAEADQ